MTGPSDEPRVALDRLSALLVEDILSASDEDILAEIREQHGDPDRLAAEMRVLFEKTVTSMNRQHLPTTQEHIASESMLNVAQIIPFPKSPPECQIGTPADRRRSDGPRALRARSPRRKLTTLRHSVYAVARSFQAYGFALLILCLVAAASTNVYEVKKQNPLAAPQQFTVASARHENSRQVPPPAAPPDRGEIVQMIARKFIAVGDMLSARVVLQRAYEHGDAQAALELARTYDPVVLRTYDPVVLRLLKVPVQDSKVTVRDSYADAAQARDWYVRAAELGSVDAIYRIKELSCNCSPLSTAQ